MAGKRTRTSVLGASQLPRSTIDGHLGEKKQRKNQSGIFLILFKSASSFLLLHYHLCPQGLCARRDYLVQLVFKLPACDSSLTTWLFIFCLSRLAIHHKGNYNYKAGGDTVTHTHSYITTHISHTHTHTRVDTHIRRHTVTDTRAAVSQSPWSTG